MSETVRRARSRGPTIADVARVAGVSSMTVSNVINGRSQRVGDATKERVLATLNELGYRVNMTARHLRTGRTGMVGLAVPDFSPGYYSELADRLADRFAERGLRLAVERTSGRRSEVESLSAARLSIYDGFVLSVVAGDVEDLEQLSVETPVVLIGERTVPARFDHVLMDNVAGARLATGHLLRSGARRIALLGGSAEGSDSMPQLRTRGYLDAHRSARVKVDRRLIRAAQFRLRDGYDLVQQLLGEGIAFDAVFALTDSTAIAALSALAEAGLRVPEDVQVIGFDNLAGSRFCYPALSTVEPGNEEMAEAICALLVNRIEETRLDDEQDRRPAQVVMPKARLVERGTTRPGEVKRSRA